MEGRSEFLDVSIARYHKMKAADNHVDALVDASSAAWETARALP